MKSDESPIFSYIKLDQIITDRKEFTSFSGPLIKIIIFIKIIERILKFSSLRRSREQFLISTRLFIEINPNFTDAYLCRGISKGHLLDYSGAIIDFDKAIMLDPTDALSYIDRGKCKIKTNEQNAGCLDFSKAGELGYADAYNIIKDLCK